MVGLGLLVTVAGHYAIYSGPLQADASRLSAGGCRGALSRGRRAAAGPVSLLTSKRCRSRAAAAPSRVHVALLMPGRAVVPVDRDRTAQALPGIVVTALVARNGSR